MPFLRYLVKELLLHGNGGKSETALTFSRSLEEQVGMQTVTDGDADELIGLIIDGVERTAAGSSDG